MRLPLIVLLCAALSACAYLPHKAGSVAAAAPTRILHLDSMTLNLADEDANAYLRLGVSLALQSPAPSDPAGDTKLETVARDSVVAIASAKTSDALLSPDGKVTLKREVLTDLQHRLPAAEVTDIYFDDFLVQR